MKLHHCPTCDKSIAITKQPGVEYCTGHSPTITMIGWDYLHEVMRSLSRQLTPAKTAVPQAIYDAFTDEEVQL